MAKYIPLPRSLTMKVTGDVDQQWRDGPWVSNETGKLQA